MATPARVTRRGKVMLVIKRLSVWLLGEGLLDNRVEVLPENPAGYGPEHAMLYA